MRKSFVCYLTLQILFCVQVSADENIVETEYGPMSGIQELYTIDCNGLPNVSDTAKYKKYDFAFQGFFDGPEALTTDTQFDLYLAGYGVGSYDAAAQNYYHMWSQAVLHFAALCKTQRPLPSHQTQIGALFQCRDFQGGGMGVDDSSDGVFEMTSKRNTRGSSPHELACKKISKKLMKEWIKVDTFTCQDGSVQLNASVNNKIATNIGLSFRIAAVQSNQDDLHQLCHATDGEIKCQLGSEGMNVQYDSVKFEFFAPRSSFAGGDITVVFESVECQGATQTSTSTGSDTFETGTMGQSSSSY